VNPALAVWMADAAEDAAGGALWSGPRHAWITGIVGGGGSSGAGVGPADAPLAVDLASLLAHHDMREPAARRAGQPMRMLGTVAGYVARFLPGEEP
jgi:hypothetical protein